MGCNLGSNSDLSIPVNSGSVRSGGAGKFLARLTLIAIMVVYLSQSAPPKSRLRTRSMHMWKFNPYIYPSLRIMSEVPPAPPPLPPPTTTTTTTPRTFAITSKRTRIVRYPVTAASSTTVKTTESNIVRRNAGNSSIIGNGVDENLTLSGKEIIDFDLGNVTAINLALSAFIGSTEGIVRELLVSLQHELLRLIGQADLGKEKVQKRLRNSTLELTLAGQRAAAETLEALPPFLNKIFRRLTTPTDGRSREQVQAQLLEAVVNLRQLKKMFVDAFDDHEKDFHNVFQERFKQINQYLRVPDLPTFPFGWFS